MSTTEPYPVEVLGEDEDNGTMPDNVAALADIVVGHRIVKAEHRPGRYLSDAELILTLDDGRTVLLADGGDCCAFTYVEAFLLHPERVDHVITGVGTTGGYTTWHIYADLGDVLELAVNWSCGNAFYYGYGFHIIVTQPQETTD